VFDPFSLLWQALAPFWWVLPLPLLAALCRQPAVKGWIGEILLDLFLRIGLPRRRYRLLRNLTLPTADGSTQIDHVVVSRHGIFVIETKNYRGWIFGKAQDKTWTQRFPRGPSYTFQNPLRQNYKHVCTLADLLKVERRLLFSMIAFVGPATLKTPMPANVGGPAACLAFIRTRTTLLFDEDEVERIMAAIEAGRLASSWATHAAHVRHVRDLAEARERARAAPVALAAPAPMPAPAPAPQADPVPVQRPACPRCGGATDTYTYRTGSMAGRSFEGCTRFPACVYRADLPEASTERQLTDTVQA